VVCRVRVVARQNTTSVTLTKIMAFSLPALRIESKLSRGSGKNESFAFPLESFSPYSTRAIIYSHSWPHAHHRTRHDAHTTNDTINHTTNDTTCAHDALSAVA